MPASTYLKLGLYLDALKLTPCLSSSLNTLLDAILSACALSTSLVLAERLALILISRSLLGEEDVLHSCEIFATLPSVCKVEELKCSQQFSACRSDFFSPSPICNPKLQQGCQGAHSLRASYEQTRRCSPGAPSVLSGVTQRACGP